MECLRRIKVVVSVLKAYFERKKNILRKKTLENKGQKTRKTATHIPCLQNFPVHPGLQLKHVPISMLHVLFSQLIGHFMSQLFP